MSLSRLAAHTRILIADPDPIVRATCREVFTPWNCDVIEAVDGREALERALVRRPTLVLTEMQLPFIAGDALCEVLRRDLMTGHVPIVVMTAATDRTTHDRVHVAGADAVIIKPLDALHVRQEVRRLLARLEDLRTESRRNLTPLTLAVNQSAARTPRMSSIGRLSSSQCFVRRTTSAPPSPPPALVLCPSCDQALSYQQSYVGGVNRSEAEQWDQFYCRRCDRQFEYRQRTRRLRLAG